MAAPPSDGGRVSPVLQRLRRARRWLLLGLATKAALVGLLVALTALLLALAVDALAGLPLVWRERFALSAWLFGALAMAWQLRRATSLLAAAGDEGIALWFERRIPALRYALVTRVTASTTATDAPALDAAIASAALEEEVRGALRTALLRPSAALLGALAVLLLLPSGAVGRVLTPAPGDSLERAGAPARSSADALATIVVRVQPPAYIGGAATALDDPATVTALPGSRVTVEGRGRDVRALAEGRTHVAAAVAGDRWRLMLPVPAAAEAVRLVSGARERVLVIEPIVDSVPILRLNQPARDTVMRVATGTLALDAEASDDYGLGAAAFELIISTGEGELYEFRTVRVGERRFDAGVRRAELRGELRLDSLRLRPGDLIHLRAIAADRNDVTGPGRGASETRTLRIARADEYDSVAVDPLPPSEPERDALSQRMLLELTRDLVRRAPRLGADATTRESRRIGVEQTKLRQRVGRAVFERLGEDEGEHAHFPGDGHAHGTEGVINPDDILAQAERAANADPTRNLDNHGDESPVVAINRPLLEAYNHMWRAGSELETGKPAAAIPWMERAIAALQRARAAERIYLRGRPPAIVVDLARVRLAGKDEGNPTQRSARPVADPARASRLARFDATLALVTRDPGAAADSLLLLRVGLPAEERSAMLALDAAATALRRGGDVTVALTAARRALLAEPPQRAPLGAWGR